MFALARTQSAIADGVYKIAESGRFGESTRPLDTEMTRDPSRDSVVGHDGERPDWEQRAKETEARLAPILGASRSKEADRFIKRHTVRVARFGSDRKGPIVSMLAHVGNYWCGAILLTLRLGVLRPSALRAAINALRPVPPISQRMLTLNLRVLERDGLIEREVYHESRPTRVEYRLTELGTELSDFMEEIAEWGTRNIEAIASARETYDARSDDFFP